MTKLDNLFAAFVSVFLMQAIATPGYALDGSGTHILDGTTIDWTYDNSEARMLVSFENGLAKYEWIAGARKGNSDKEIPYNSRELTEGVFLMNWVQPQKPDFISMIFDFNTNKAYSSGLIGYGTERQKNLFLSGVVNSDER